MFGSTSGFPEPDVDVGGHEGLSSVDGSGESKRVAVPQSGAEPILIRRRSNKPQLGGHRCLDCRGVRGFSASKAIASLSCSSSWDEFREDGAHSLGGAAFPGSSASAVRAATTLVRSAAAGTSNVGG